MIFNLIKHAKQLLFNNSKSGLSATNTQDAIDELNSKVNTLDGELDTKVTNNFTPERAVYVDANGNLVASGTVTDTELGYLGGVTSNIQAQLSAKLSKSGGQITGAITTSGNASYETDGNIFSPIYGGNLYDYLVIHNNAINNCQVNIQNLWDTKANLNGQPYFSGIKVGSETSQAYIYSEDENINFRYKQANGDLAFSNLRQMCRGTVSGTTLNITLG